MNDFLDRISKLSPQRLALLAVELNERVQAAERSRRAPVAIVGIGCRLPGGVRDAEGFWKLLNEGVDAVSEVPSDRWDVEQFYHRNPDTPGKMATRWGGFIEGPDQFDPGFFGIAPAEAASMDPQQRLLLETSWEALEHAGIVPASLAGTRTGVFVGICNGDYSQIAMNSPREKITPYFAPGLSHAVAAGRISYVFGLQGPSMAVDTSCSASLVAVHLACQSLRLGESSCALAGGVNLILNPDITIALSQSRMMAPDGRCKAFSESANGFVRGEGCGVVVLKRLSDALRDRNRILAVIRGSACNQDGRSSGLTAPNGPSQEAVISSALADAGLRPVDVDYIEAHGTGTVLGDPIEIGSLNAVFADRSAETEPLFVGSVKTNIGHLEPAAGIAGLIKLILSLQRGTIPASLHFDKPNSRIEWGQMPIRVSTQLQPWRRRGEKRVGGVSSFGFSGTNAHVVVEEHIEQNRSEANHAGHPLLFPLSAKTPTALKIMAANLHRHLNEHPSLPLADVAYTLSAGRSRFEYRAAIIAASRTEVLQLLDRLRTGSTHPDIHMGQAKRRATGPAIDGHREVPDKTLGNDDERRTVLHQQASLFVIGGELDMESLYPDQPAAVVSLPTYPFERERYWLEDGRPTSRLVPANVAIDSEKRSSTDTEGWIYDLVWEPKPLLQNTKAPFKANLIETLPLRGVDDELVHYSALNVQFHPVCAAYIAEAIEALGARSLPDRVFTLSELSDRLEVATPRRRLFERLLAILVEDDMIQKTSAGFRIGRMRNAAKQIPTARTQLRKLEEDYPLCRTEMNVLARCGENLAAVLTGKIDPVHLLFPNNSVEETEHIYSNSPMARYYNELIADQVEAAVEHASGRPVRILEIGAGTGATTRSIISRLGGKKIEYTFTDISPAFLARARVKFSECSSLEYRPLNIENDPAGQGFDLRRHDIIVAANVLHATADLRHTLANVQALLAPGGLALLLEGMRPDRAVDLTFGLTDGWWRFADRDVRPDYPLVSADTWTHLLREAGMTSTRVMTYPADNHLEPSHQMVVVAQAAGHDSAGKERPHRRYVIFEDESGIGESLNVLLKNAGERCQLLRRAGSNGVDISRVREILSSPDGSAIEIIYLCGADVADPAAFPGALSEAEERCVKTPVHIIQEMVASTGAVARLRLVTRGAQPTSSFSPGADGAAQSMMWGVGRVFGLEHPERYGGMIDLEPGQSPRQAATCIFAELQAEDMEDQVAYRGGERLALRLRNTRLESSTARPIQSARLRKDGAYLITGGLGGIGLRFSLWAASQGAGNLVLLGRTGTGASAGPYAAERSQAVREMEQLGAKVTIVEGDVTSQADMELLFRRFAAELPPLRGIVHAATALSNQELAALTDEQIETMLAPKVRGSWMLHALTKDLDLDFFLAFSSAASVLGGRGMAHYAAANIFMDTLAHTRRASGLPMLAVNWGAWDVMRRFTREDRDRFAQMGLLPMESEALFHLIGELIHSSRAQVMVANVDWKVMKPVLESNRVRPMLETIDRRRPQDLSPNVPAFASVPSLHTAIGMTPEDRKTFVEKFVLEQAACVLGFRRGELPPADVPLTDLGLDSLMAVDLKNHLQTALGRELSPTIVFDFPTVSGIVGMLETMLWATHSGSEDALASVQKDEICI